MTSTFRGCRNLKEIENINFNNTLVESMISMFSNCASLTSLDLRNFTSSKYQINMDYMFQLCQKLQYIKFPQNEIFYVKSMTRMFDKCQSLISLDLSCFNTSQVKVFDYLFQECRHLEYINLKNFETSSLEDISRKMGKMRRATNKKFHHCQDASMRQFPLQ
jgi:surface protein